MAIKQLEQQFAKKIFVDDSAVDGAIASVVSSSNQFSAAYSNLQSNVVNTAMQMGQTASKVYDQKVNESYQKGVEDAAANTSVDLLEAEVTAEQNEGWFDKLFTSPQEAYATAYDKSQKVVVQNNINTKLNEAMSIYAQKNPTDVAGFREKMDSWKKSPQDLLLELDIEHEFTPETKEFAIRALADNGSKYIPKIISNQLQEQRALQKQTALQNLESTRNTMAQTARTGDEFKLGETIAVYDKQLQVHITEGSITPAEAQQLRYEFNKVQHVEYVQGDVDESFHEVSAALNGNFANYPNALASAQERIEGGAAIMSTIKDDSGNLIYSRKEIDAWKNGQHKALDTYKDIAKSRITEATSLHKIDTIMNDPNDIVDISNKSEVKAAENAYKTLKTQVTQQIQTMADTNQISQEDADKLLQEHDIRFVENTGYVPEVIRSDIRTGLASNDPNTVVRATTRLMQLTDSNQAVNNYVTRQFSEKEIKDAISIQANIDAGLTPEDAVILQRQAGSRDGKATFDYNTRDMKKEDWSKEVNNIVDDFVEDKQSVFVDDADPTDAIQAQMRMDAKQLYTQYLSDPNITSREAAQKMVLRELQNRYQNTNVNGETEVTRYSMEVTHGAWALEQANDMRDKASKVLKIEPSQIRFEAEPKSGAKGKPVYFVLTQNEDGDWKQLYDESGRPRVFRPNKETYQQQRDVKLTELEKEQERKHQESVKRVEESQSSNAYIQRAQQAMQQGVDYNNMSNTDPWVLRAQQAMKK